MYKYIYTYMHICIYTYIYIYIHVDRYTIFLKLMTKEIYLLENPIIGNYRTILFILRKLKNLIS